MAKLPLSLTTKMLASCSGQEKHGNRPKLYRYANKEKNSNAPLKPLFIKKKFFYNIISHHSADLWNRVKKKFH